MNHVYRLVWNRALQLLQAASELAGSPRGSDAIGITPTRVPRRHALAMACALALGTASLLPLSAWAATSSAAGGTGGHGGSAAAGSGGVGNGGGGQGGGEGSDGALGAPGNNGNGGAGGHSGTQIPGGTSGAVGGTSIGAASVNGGNGGNGLSDPGASFSSGGGGGGGDGVYSSDLGLSLGSGLSITGGNGGNGGAGNRIGGGGGGGGAGLVALQATTLSNAGIITGGNGGNGAAGQWSGGGGGGGGGVLMSANAGAITNLGSIIGGRGGDSGGVSTFSGGNGGGGAGINLAGDGDSVTNSGTIVGGKTGGSNTGGNAGSGILVGGASSIVNQVGGSVAGGNNSDSLGVGGTGVAATTAGSQQVVIDNAGTISGGIGGYAVNGDNKGNGGQAIAAIGNVLISNTGLIQGGKGGTNMGGGIGGVGILITADLADGEQAGITNLSGGVIEGGYGGTPGNGNNGGLGISASGNVTITNQAGASILGDNGGLSDISTHGANAIVASNGASIDNSGIVAGTGGVTAGAAIVASAASIVNRAGGLIVGGNGQDAMAGRAGIVAAGGVSIDNSGSIVGGHADATGVQADAVNLSGGGNTLLLRAGSSITGNVTSSSGTGAGGDSLILGGDVDAGGGNTFDVGTASGFAGYGKSGTSTWTLTGNGSASQQWSIATGKLIGNSHAIVGNVVDNAVLVFNQVDNGSYAGVISGSGTLAKNGSGTLTFTGNNIYSGGTTLNAGTLNISDDGNLGDAAGALTMTGATLQAGAAFTSTRAITVTGDNTIDTNGFNVTLDGPIRAGVNDAAYHVLDKSGSGTLTLAGANTYYSATTISAGTLALAGAGAIGTGSLNVAAGTTFDISQVQSGASVTTFGGNGNIALGARTLTLGLGSSNSSFNGSIADGGIAGGTGGRVVIVGSQGVVDFFGTSSYTGGTTITAGTLALVNGGALDAAGAMTVDTAGSFDIAGINAAGTSIGDLAGRGNVDLGAKSLTLGSANDTIFAGVIAGSGGALTKQGSGALVLDGINTYTGGTTVAAGTLLVGDDAHSGASIAGNVIVDSGATLGGHGSIGGSVDVLAGAHLAPGGSIGTLSMGGDASFAQGSVLDFEFGAPGADFNSLGVSDSVHVGDDLSLAGAVLNISDAGGFEPGLYNLFTYGGTLSESNGGIVFGSTPGGQYSVQYLTAQKQVNLINTSGLTLNFWNANGLASATRMGGGSGSWSVTSPNWTDAGGSVSAPMQPQPGFAIFGGDAGTVTVDNGAGAVNASGMQFAGDGYVLGGDTLRLIGSGGSAPVIRVGDGSSAGADWTAAIGNVIAGSDGLVKADAGTLVLSGSNTYAGGSTISGGTLSVSSDANLGAASGALTLDGGVLQVTGNTFGGTTRALSMTANGGGFDIAAAGNAFTVSQALDGSGSLLKLGAGTLVLTGANSYNGGTRIDAGTLQVGDGGTLGSGAVTDSGTLVFDRSDALDFAGVISGSGALVKQGAGVLTLSGANSYGGGTTISAGTLRGDTGSLQGDIVDNGRLVFEQAADGMFADAISGTGQLAKSGAGSLTLSGDSHAYAGTAALDAGALVVDGTLGGTLVTAAGTRLSGSGTLGNLDLAGTLAPGHSIGTLSASGDVVIRNGASYEVETDAAGHSDLLAVAGHATLQGGSVLNFAADGSYAAQTTYTILTAAGGVDGQFGTVTTTLAFLDPRLDYLANAVQLTLARNDVDFCAVTVTANQCATGKAVQDQGGTLYDALLTQDAITTRDALGQWSGESLASTRTALLEDSRFVREAMNERLHRVDSTQDSGRAIGKTAGSIWLHGWDHSGHVDGDGNASTLQSDGSGALLGMDAPLGDWLRAGITGGEGQDSLAVNALDSSAYVKSRHLGLYAGSHWGGWSLDGGVAESWHDIRSTRRIDAVLPGTLRADYHGRTRQAYLEGGYRFAGAHGSVQPFVNLAHVAVHTDAVNESGSVTALRSEGETSETSFGTVGVHGLWQLADSAATPVSLYATLGWRHAFGDLVPLAQQQFAGGGRFTVEGVPLSANAALVQLGVDAALSKHASLRAGYDGVLAGGESDHAVRMTLQVTF